LGAYKRKIDTAKEFYDELFRIASEEDGETIFRGHPTKILTENVGAPLPYYSEIKGMLEQMECIEALRRGGGAEGLSVWRLIKPPTDELWTVKQGTYARSRAIRRDQTDIIAKLITDLDALKTRVTFLENQVAVYMALENAE
jgi:hypothetical protein